ncbi:peptidase inhibitor family I36 protein [Streptomyces sp. NPDC055897]
MTRTMRAAAFVASAAAVTTLGLTGPASASAEHSAFEAQSLRAGLSQAQSTQLQHQVDEAIAESGGHQVAANMVDLGGGSTLRLPVPGEASVRDLATTHGSVTSRAAAAHVCPPKDFCAYTGVNYTGKEQRFGECTNQKLKGSGWSGAGSWYNNQSKPYMRATMYGKQGQWVFEDNGPGSHDTHGNWAKVWSITPC